ncbi:MAG: SDR family NAD(P)-dependent oxidoreductase, partial [Erythrobacter sp.]|nr:SDR family NAD(P)-dependent oxidoreductase [Erythrobacter sp.]
MAFKPFDLTGKAAVITGGNGGIGLGMAEGLAAAGADIAIWGRNADKNAAALERLKAHGTRIEALEVDVADEQAVVDAMAESLSRLGRIDSCIANAGVGGAAPLIEQTTEQWRKVTAVNLDAVFWTFREASKHMVARAESGDKGGSLLV